jgi:hypothetical protein
MKFKSDIEVQAGVKDSAGSSGNAGSVLSSTSTGVTWIDNYADWTSVVKHIVKNNGVAVIPKGAPVYVTGSNGTNMLVGLAGNGSEATSSKTMGLVQTQLGTSGSTQTGYVVTEGLLQGLNTAGRTAGEPIWLGPNGTLIYGLANKPYAPAHLVFMGIVTKISAGNGEVFVKVQNGSELNEIHDVDLKTNIPINGDVLGYDGTLWVNKTIAGWLGYVPVNSALTISTTAPLQGGGDLTTNRTLSITQAGASSNGFLSSTDWSTFNSKQNALSGTGFVKISGTTISYDNTSYLPLTGGTITGTLTFDGSGGTTAPIVSVFNTGLNRLLTPVLRLYGPDNIGSKYVELFGSNATANRTIQFPDASGTAVLGSGTTNYIPKFTNANIIGNSLIFDNGTNVGIGTTTPSTRLDVYNNAGSDLITGRIGSSAVSAFILAGHNLDAFNAGLAIKVNNAGSMNEAMRITSGGNVGIGTTSPSVQFNVGHAIHGVGIAYLATSSLPSTAGFFTDSGVNGGQGFGSLQIKSRTDFSGYSINFFTASTANVPVERMRVTSGGNVLIGTSTDNGSRLQVNGNVSVGSGNGGQASTLQLLTNGVSPISNRITYGTDGTGWKFAIGKNQAGTITDQFVIQTNGNVSIGTANPDSYLAGTVGLVNFHATSPALSLGNNSTYWLNYLAGTEYRFFNPTNSVVHTIFLNGNYSFLGTNVSDIRLKEDIQELNVNYVEKVTSLKPKSYFMKDNKNRKHYGFIAQEVYETIPDLISGDINGEEYLGVDYNGIITLLVGSIKELKAEIEILKLNK